MPADAIRSVFTTESPISVIVELGAGDIRITAGDREDTVVEVRGSGNGREADTAAAEATRVEFADGILRISSGWGQPGPGAFGGGAVAVAVELPTGSTLRGKAGMAPLHAAGRLGECRYQTGAGDIRVEEAGGVAELATGHGDIGIAQARGSAEAGTGSGAVRIGAVGGTAVVRNGNGDTWIGEAGGDVRVNAANGRITVDRAHAGVAARTANGEISLGEVSRGEVLAHTASGSVTVGVRDGVAAWLDIQTRHGSVDRALDAAGQPEPGEDTVAVQVRTSYGDISVHRVGARSAAGRG